MIYAIYLFSGCASLFFGYDTAVMSQVNDNDEYIQMMGVTSDSGRDAAAIGGLFSLRFGGFALGIHSPCSLPAFLMNSRWIDCWIYR